MNLIKKVIKKIKEGILQEMWEETKWMYKYAKKYKFVILFYIIDFAKIQKDLHKLQKQLLC